MNEKKTFLILSFLGILVAVLILCIDRSHNADREEEGDVNSLKETLMKDRKFIQVEVSQLGNLIAGASADQDLSGLKGPIVVKDIDGWTAFIDVKEGVTPYGLIKLLGTPKSKEWDSCYSVGNNLHFDAEIKDGDTVVSCPAYFLANLVQYYEKSTTTP